MEMLDSAIILDIYHRLILGKPPRENETEAERRFRKKLAKEMREFEEANPGKVIWDVPSL